MMCASSTREPYDPITMANGLVVVLLSPIRRRYVFVFAKTDRKPKCLAAVGPT